MIDFNKLLPKNLYHSYVIEGDRDTVTGDLKIYFEEKENNKNLNVDFFCKNYDAFSVDDSTDVKDWQVIKNNNDAPKICILGFYFINHDAERSLLKMLEEPKENTYFFLITPNASKLLDTILSRVHVIKIENKENNKIIDANIFLKNTKAVRLEQVAELIKTYKDIEGSGGVRNASINLVNDLEEILYKNWQQEKIKDNKEIFDILNKARDYLSIPGCSPKMILEQIALVL